MERITELCRTRKAVDLLLTRELGDSEQQMLLKMLIDVHCELNQIEQDNIVLSR